MMVSRRWFAGSMLSALATARIDVFASLAKGMPRLKFGVVSDIHVTHVGRETDTYAYGSGTTFRKALEWFRDQGADAIVCAGDMADRGTYANLQVVADIWKGVFPGNKAPDGRMVEPVFLYGNHDADARWFELASGQLNNKTPEQKAKLLSECIANTREASWERAFGEKYADVYMKRVKGYAFVCSHWGCETKLPEFLDAHKVELMGEKPFFYAQHPHPKGTCYGKWAWGADNGTSTKVLSQFPNAVAFSGHSHTPLALAQTIWQGAFTSIGTSSLSYLGILGDDKCLNRKPAWNAKDKTLPSFMTVAEDRSREGLLVTVYDDHIVIACREFVKEKMLCAGRILPLPHDPAKAPYSFANQAARLPLPMFPSGAKVQVVRKVSEKGDEYVVAEFPSVVCDGRSVRSAWYEMSVFNDGKCVHTAKISAVDFFAPPDCQPKKQTIAFPFSVLPTGGGVFRCEIRARDLFGRVSEALRGEFS